MTVTTGMPATAAPRGWASKDDKPGMFPGVQHVWKRRRLAAGLKQSTVIRHLVELAALEGVQIATPASLQTMLSGWENGVRQMSPAYEALLCRVYGIPHPGHASTRAGRYRNNAIYDRLLPALPELASPTVPGLR